MNDFKANFNLKDKKMHLVALALVLVAEMIGTVKFNLTFAGGSSIAFSFLPMLFAIAIGLFLGGTKKVDLTMMNQASPYIGISVLYLSVKSASTIGSNWPAIVAAGPALIFQELGNLGTIVLSLPVALLVFKMGRAAIGACFSISREGSLAVIADRYGLDSPEGTGVMGAYITGTVLGTVFFGLLAGIFAGTNLFHPYALAMASGMGSASMMSASLAPVIEAHPDMASVLQAYAATSQTLTGADGLYMNLLVAIPACELGYKLLVGNKEKKLSANEKATKTALRVEQGEEEKPVQKSSEGAVWAERIKGLLISGIYACIANTIYTWRNTGAFVMPWNYLPAIGFMFAVILIGTAIHDVVCKATKASIPSMLFVAMLTTVLSFPFCGGIFTFMTREVGKVGLLPLCTPILAYSGIASGKEIKTFKEQGIAIVCVALLTFAGTYIGSAAIANIILKTTGVI